MQVQAEGVVQVQKKVEEQAPLGPAPLGGRRCWCFAGGCRESMGTVNAGTGGGG